MGSGTFAKRLRRSAALGTVVAVLGLPAFAQDAQQPSTVEQIKPPDSADASATTESKDNVIVVTGTRLQSNQFTSSSPMTVISADSAADKGISDVASLLRDSTVASGSPQITAITSTAFVQNGGTGVESISLRGLGSNRTLVLLDGKRAGPAGTRGSVGAFDLNVIPLSAVERVDILKDGASSIYGSDAVAGVVNIITKKGNDSSVNAFYSAPTAGGGATTQIDGSWGFDFGSGNFRLTADYYKQNELKRGDRDYFDCASAHVYNSDGSLADVKDPRTGKIACTSDLLWGHNWTYEYGPDTPRPWQKSPADRYQYDYDGSLGQVLPPYLQGASNGVHVPAGWYPVGYNNIITGTNDPYYSPSAAASYAAQNFHSPFQDVQSLSPEVERMTIYGSGDYDLNDHVQLYADMLLNRRTTKLHSYRQFWTFQYVYDYGYAYSGVPDGNYVGDPNAISQGWTGDAIYFSPTSITDHAGDTTQVDYFRFLGGAKGDFDFVGLKGWTWDASVQYSHSRGTYKTDIIWDDAITPYQYAGVGGEICTPGDVTDYRGVPCVNVNWYDPQFLAGNISAEDQAFLFGTIKGKTTYEETSFEGYMTGNVVQLPAGPLSLALGVNYQRDSINDVPAQATQDGATWGDSKAGITTGSDETKAVFAELSIPVLKDLPAIKNLTLSASGRYTDVSSYGSGNTYKVGLNWEVTPWLRFRGSQGTSFRSPALFELYLASETSFGSLRDDPCVNWAAQVASGAIPQIQADNCAADGVPGDHGSAGVTPTITSSGGKGLLKAETSTAKTLGMVLTPTLPSSFGDLQFSIDYIDIEVDNEVTRLGESNILLGCYLSTHHSTDPLCDLFTRLPSTGSGAYNLATVTDDYINVSTQQNRGVDLEALYRVDLPVGRLNVRAQATRGLEVKVKTLPTSEPRDFIGEIGNPDWVGNLDVSYDFGKWSFFYGIRYLGKTSNEAHFGTGAQTYLGNPVHYVLSTPDIYYHDISVSRDLPGNMTLRLGVSNLFDKDPPQVTTIAGEYGTVGNVPIAGFDPSNTSQQGAGFDFFGRTVFVNLKKSF